jgi:hypothetical protein
MSTGKYKASYQTGHLSHLLGRGRYLAWALRLVALYPQQGFRNGRVLLLLRPRHCFCCAAGACQTVGCALLMPRRMSGFRQLELVRGLVLLFRVSQGLPMSDDDDGWVGGLVFEGWVYELEGSVANLLVRNKWSIASPYLPGHVLFVNVCMPPYTGEKLDTMESTLPQSFLRCLVLPSCSLKTCLAFFPCTR